MGGGRTWTATGGDVLSAGRDGGGCMAWDNCERGRDRQVRSDRDAKQSRERERDGLRGRERSDEMGSTYEEGRAR